MGRQRGLSLLGLIVIGILIALVAVVGMKVAPSVIEYFNILKAVKSMAGSGELRGATVADVRRSFDKRADVGYITSINGSDLDIGKEGNDIVISFAYSKKIPIFGNVSICIDFEGSSASG